MINRHDSCVGVTLFKLWRFKLELWFVPTNYECQKHIHQDSHGEFFVVFGRNRSIYRILVNEGLGHIVQEYNVDNRKYFKWLTVRANTPHGFSKGTTPMIFLCLTKWKPNIKVTSPSVDFKYT